MQLLLILSKKNAATLLLTLLILSSSLCSCMTDGIYRTDEGAIWATQYHIKYKAPRQMTDSILATLRHVEMSVSVFNDSSLVSRLNHCGSLTADSILAKVFNGSKEVNSLSNGAFDPTLGPLIELWGFGRNRSITQTPPDSLITKTLQYVGIAQCSIDSCGIIRKKHPLTQFNFSAIAKGLACDEVGLMMQRNGITDYMIEIGGEVALSGNNERGEKWRLSVDAPLTDENNPAAHHRLTMIDVTDCGVATSGNYRNYHEVSGHTIGHTISPATGRPVDKGCLSATVIAPDCMMADALATACMAMQPDSAMVMIEGLPHTEVMMVLPGNPYRTVTSKGFPELHH